MVGLGCWKRRTSKVSTQQESFLDWTCHYLSFIILWEFALHNTGIQWWPLIRLRGVPDVEHSLLSLFSVFYTSQPVKIQTGFLVLSPGQVTCCTVQRRIMALIVMSRSQLKLLGYMIHVLEPPNSRLIASVEWLSCTSKVSTHRITTCQIWQCECWSFEVVNWRVSVWVSAVSQAKCRSSEKERPHDNHLNGPNGGGNFNG